MSKNIAKRIAFIVDPAADPESLIRYVLTGVDGERDRWHVWNPNARSGRAQVRSQTGYAQALFVLLSYAVYKAASVSAVPRGARSRPRPTESIRIGKRDEIHWPWASRAFNVIQNRRKYKAIREEFRKGLAPLLSAASRAGKQNDPRIEVSSDCCQYTYFWAASSDILARKDVERHAQDGSLLRLSPSSLPRIDVDRAYRLLEIGM